MKTSETEVGLDEMVSVKIWNRKSRRIRCTVPGSKREQGVEDILPERGDLRPGISYLRYKFAKATTLPVLCQGLLLIPVPPRYLCVANMMRYQWNYVFLICFSENLAAQRFSWFCLSPRLNPNSRGRLGPVQLSFSKASFFWSGCVRAYPSQGNTEQVTRSSQLH